jgi:hypothetical protein
MLLKALNNVHLPTWLFAFIAWIIGSFVVTMNGTPVDLSTTDGRLNVVMAVFMAAIAFLQKVTPTTLK